MSDPWSLPMASRVLKTVRIPGQHESTASWLTLPGDNVEPPDGGGAIAVDGFPDPRGLRPRWANSPITLSTLPLRVLRLPSAAGLGYADGQGTGQFFAGVGGARIDGLAGLHQGLVEMDWQSPQHVGNDIERRLLRVTRGDGRVADIEQR